MNTVVGTDVQSLDEVAASRNQFGTRYTRRLFTSHEIESCGENLATAASGFVARCAAKEAVLKILDVREIVPPWKAIEIRRTTSGRPEIVLLGVAAELAHRQGIEEISLSISHGAGVVIAAAVAQANGRCRSGRL